MNRTIHSLTGLRIFAALVVYLSHVGVGPGGPPLLQRFANSGYMGVTLFFVLSGFVLTHRYQGELVSPTARGLWRYTLARFARIYPLYVFVLLFVALRLRSVGAPLDGLWLHVFGLQAWSSDVNVAFNFNGPAWSISVEFFLYACFPALMFILSRFKLAALVVTAVSIIMVLFALAWWFSSKSASPLDANSSHRWLYRSPVTRLGDFTLGMIAARVAASRRPSKIGAYLAAGGIVACVVMMCSQTMFYSSWSWDAAYALPAVAIIFGLAVATPTSALSRSLSWTPLVRLGEASFAFYLIHVQMVALTGAALWANGWTPDAVMLELMFLALTLCAGIGLHIAVELPARRLILHRFKALHDRPATSARLAEPRPTTWISRDVTSTSDSTSVR